MAVKIRLARHGAKKRPYYRIVVADARACLLYTSDAADEL